MSATHLYLGALAAYLVAALIAALGLKKSDAPRGHAQTIVIAAGIVLHSAGIGVYCAQAKTHFFTSQAEVLSLFSWSLALGYLGLLAVWRMRVLGILVMPLSAGLLAAGFFLPAPGPTPSGGVASHPLFATHVLTAFLGYGLFLTACAASVVYLQEHRLLKQKTFSILFRGLPSLQQLERAVGLLSWVGLGLFTVAVGTGIILAQASGHPEWYREPQVLSAIAVWLVFLVLCIGRLAGRLAGRATAHVVLIGAGLVLVTFVISHPFYVKTEDSSKRASVSLDAPANEPGGVRP